MMDLVFTAEARERLRAALIEAARADANVVAAATTGSAALDNVDEWSDIDLALCVEDEALAVREWSDRMYGRHGAVHHLDVFRGRTRFRVFLLADTLQVDVAFWAPGDFGAIGPAFRLLFGTAAGASAGAGAAGAAAGVSAGAGAAAADRGELVGYAWLYALHTRSSIARGRVWQAAYMLDNARHATLALACAARDLPSREGRGTDRLPPDVLARFAPTIAASPDADELRRAFAVLVDVLRAETQAVDAALAARVDPVLAELPNC